MNILNRAYNLLWSEWFWLPRNIAWDDLKPGSYPGVKFTENKMCLLAIPIAIGLIVLRYLFTKFIFEKYGKTNGIRSRHARTCPPNPILEASYNQNKKLTHRNIISLMKQSELNEREIERWWRLRTIQDKPTVLDKFCETCWQCLYYTTSFIFGLIILYDKPYLYDFDLLLKGHPYQSFSTSSLIYILMTLGYYLSLTICHFWDAKRKDFWQMLFHHLTAMFLIWFAWTLNFIAISTVVIILHDVADILLYCTKIFQYLKKNNTAFVVTLLVFVGTFVVSRLGFFGRIIYSTYVSKHVTICPAYVIIFCMMLILYGLHCYWTSLCFRIIYAGIKNHNLKEQDDIRSDDSSASEEISDEKYDDQLIKQNLNGETADINYNSVECK